MHDDPAAARSGELRFASPPGGHRGAGAIVGRESSIDGRYRVLTGAAAASKTGSDVDQADVRFGSKADICGATSHVRFTPNSDRESRHPQTVMSALPPKADMCSANLNVRYGPKADIPRSTRSPRQRGRAAWVGSRCRLPWRF